MWICGIYGSGAVSKESFPVYILKSLVSCSLPEQTGSVHILIETHNNT